MEDYWKHVSIQDYTDRYLISRNGEIWSIKRQSLVSPCLRNGYPSVSLYNGEKKTFYIHILVATAFLPCNDPTLIVNHKNGIITDSRVENFEWVTYKENSRHALQNNLKIPHTKTVSQYTFDGVKVATYNSIKEAALATGCSDKKIPTVCRGKRRSTGGFVWRY